ncbi:MliC family protein [Ruegeria sp. 2012CJ41-6]|uniref:MliC family protein n=1 Tax=Ruegeria spongiae TaxID=2942209 RepID=A0ABT0Q3Y8_9RHOB|nr:MliC family protein [Ruegeria spongiae]MCL6284322.1 MliC family protein [Ruegeria spongiae]
MKAVPLLIALAAMAGPAVADVWIETTYYICERGAEVTATHVGKDADAAVVLLIEGNQIGLPVTRSGSGVRFAEPGGGYVWHEKGRSALLLWEEGASTQAIYAECQSD